MGEKMLELSRQPPLDVMSHRTCAVCTDFNVFKTEEARDGGVEMASRTICASPPPLSTEKFCSGAVIIERSFV